jgi:hypothetical protein
MFMVNGACYSTRIGWHLIKNGHAAVQPVAGAHFWSFHVVFGFGYTGTGILVLPVVPAMRFWLLVLVKAIRVYATSIFI